MAEAQVEHALAQVMHREAALYSSRVDLAHTVIRSPVDGVTIERSVDMGQTVAASLQAPTLFTIAQDLRAMQVEASLDEADIGRIQVGQKATFTVDAFPGREFNGRVEQIRKAPTTVQNVVTYTVVVSAKNDDLRLLPGMTANVQVIVDERSDALKVPNAALRFRPPDAQAAPVKVSGSIGPGGSQGRGPRQGGGNLNRLVEELRLNEDQQAQIRAIFSGIRQEVMAMRQQGATPEDIRTEVKRLREQNQKAILPILTQEQREKYRGMMAKRATNPVTRGLVWVLGEDGKLSPVEIFTGVSDGAFTEIVRGDIDAGKEVIVGSKQPATRKQSSMGGRRFGF
jgi:HlyD family secretion protein